MEGPVMITEEKPKSRETTAVLESVLEPPVQVQPPRPQARIMLPVITWEKLPADFILPDDPVDNILQPAIAAGLTEILHEAGLVSDNALTCTDYGIIATVDGKTIAKAPDWAYIAQITVPIEVVDRSYTPHLEGEVPTIVLEFLSSTDGTEFSMKPANPMGKWYFYEQVLKVPYYGIFEPLSGDFQVYKLNDAGRYDRLLIEESGRYWIEPMQLSIAAWKGIRHQRMGYWLRFWDAEGNLLPWASEKRAEKEAEADRERQRADQEADRADQESQRAEQAFQRAEQETQRAEQEAQRAEQEAQRAEQEAQRAEQEAQRADRLAQRLKDLGLDSD
jgi:Putative restriction endonuclease